MTMLLGVAVIRYCTCFRLFESILHFFRTLCSKFRKYCDDDGNDENAVILFEVQDTQELEKIICGSSKLTQHKETGTREEWQLQMLNSHSHSSHNSRFQNDLR